MGGGGGGGKGTTDKISFSSPEPLVFRLEMSLTSGSGRTKKFEFFHWLTENECAAEMKIKKLYAVHFTSGPVRLEVDGGNGGTFVDCSEFAGALYQKKRKANGDYSRSIRRNRKSVHLTKEVHSLQRCHSRS